MLKQHYVFRSPDSALQSGLEQKPDFTPKGYTELLKQHYVFRSPDSALQSGLEQKPDFTPKGPQVWKGFVSMQDVAKFVTTAYRISGPSDKLVCFIKVFFYK